MRLFPIEPLVLGMLAITIVLCFGAYPCIAKTLDVSLYGGDIDGALGDAESGDTVFLPSGTYEIRHTLSIPSGVALKGQSSETAVIKYAGERPGDMVSITGAADVELCGFTLDGAMEGHGTQGIVASYSSRLYIHDLIIRDFAPMGGLGPIGVYFAKEVTDSAITGNVITNIGVGSEWGSGMRLAWGSARNRVEGNVIDKTGRGGILCNDGSSDLVIRRNRISGSGGEGLGIELWGGCPRSVVEDNVIDHWLSVDSSDLSAVRRNIISDKTGTFKYLGLELVASQNVVFTDNLVDDGAVIGLSLSNDPVKRYAYFAYNTYSMCSQWGAQIQGDKEGVDCVYLYKEKFLNTRGKHPSQPYPGDAGHGFRINGNTRNLVLDSVDIKGNGGLGIQVGGPKVDRLSVIGSSIVDNRGNASSVPALPNLEWDGNTVQGNKSNRQLTPKGFADVRPTVSLDLPKEAAVSRPVAFAANAADTDGGIVHWLWDFGAGLPSTEPRPTFSYDAPGSYRVSVVVWDDKGRAARDEARINVTAQ